MLIGENVLFNLFPFTYAIMYIGGGQILERIIKQLCTLKKTSNTPFIILLISSMILILAIWNLQHIKFTAFKGIFWIFKNQKPNILGETTLIRT